MLFGATERAPSGSRPQSSALAVTAPETRLTLGYGRERPLFWGSATSRLLDTFLRDILEEDWPERDVREVRICFHELAEG